ncbi:hypothetical protein B0H14DRAFT_2485084 [Mycena olivaceomarginata]|nr:hypothetical protein B0H14DRAFT_2485084 [Mycena olivaceomarginata]
MEELQYFRQALKRQYTEHRRFLFSLAIEVREKARDRREHAWQEYQDAAEVFYAKAPTTARYCVKWKASEGKLVLKITDNTTGIKFKTCSSIVLNPFEALNLSLMEKTQNRRKV